MRANTAIRQPPPLMAPPPSLSTPPATASSAATATSPTLTAQGPSALSPAMKMARHQPGRRPPMHAPPLTAPPPRPSGSASPTPASPSPSAPQKRQQSPALQVKKSPTPSPASANASASPKMGAAGDGSAKKINQPLASIDDANIILLRVVCDDNTIKTVKANVSTYTFMDIKNMFKAKFNPDDVNSLIHYYYYFI